MAAVRYLTAILTGPHGPRTGSQIGPNVTHSLLGAARMGEVYRGRDTRLSGDVAGWPNIK